jgi:hypothetical protein
MVGSRSFYGLGGGRFRIGEFHSGEGDWLGGEVVQRALLQSSDDFRVQQVRCVRRARCRSACALWRCGEGCNHGFDGFLSLKG